MKNGIRMSDIAKELGVSVVTVSNALNDRGGVSEDMRRKIKERASELGYRPSAPRTPRKAVPEVQQQGGSIGILTSERFANVRGTFYWFLTAGVSKELTHCNLYSVYESISEADERSGVLPRIAAERQVRGLIIVGQLATDYLERLASLHLPMLFLDFYDKHSEIDAVISDNFYDSYLMTDRLVQLGHKKIGFIGSVTATSSIHDRFLGYIKCLMENGLEYRKDWTLEDRLPNGYSLTEFAFPEEMPTAFVCNCDETAFRVIGALQRREIRVPEDISVTGYDNYTVSDMCVPAITTVEVDLAEMAHAAVSLLLKRIENPQKQPSRYVIRGSIILKQSMAAPRED
ncbi:MAG: LacI family DNA-binding transcriptional regulator [Oscillospiraceae bacterium]|nr:LacI family DNA-binding transcriptional regulator [Oscillospiraceae bacterium]MBR5362879.1 LacI family DNA-binding transcriptional regulator [Oscillospiraceae bacterium]